MEMVDPRAALAALIGEHGESFAALSSWLGRNPAYLQQFVSRGSPRQLAERDRRALAGYFGVAESVLGGPVEATAPTAVEVPRFEVAVSAGPGATAEDRPAGTIAIDPGLVRTLGVRPGDLSTVRAAGDSMWPTIADDDELLVDHADRKVTRVAGIFVLRLDDVVLVKRVRCDGVMLAIESDNPVAAPIAPRLPREVEVIGRVVHLARRIR